MIIILNEYRIDTSSYRITRYDRPVEVEPQVFTVLQVLIENRHRTVTKEDLIDHVWQGRVMSDAAISSRIKSARQAIGDDGKTQRFIKTQHGIGFRFIGDVEIYPSPQDSPLLSAPSSVTANEATDHRPSIVILPFNAKSEKENNILAHGLAHDIITALSRLRWLKVISRSSAFQVANGTTDLQTLCQLTSVRYCLSGFLTVHSGYFTLSYELSDLQSGAVLVADQVQMRNEWINEVRQDIIKQLISSLELQISENEAQRAQLKSAENLDAWEAYHLATAHLYRFTATDNEKATALFRRATQLEPQFARAHAGLSAAEFQNAFNLYPGIDRKTSVSRAIGSAERSVELDRLDPLANFVMGRSHWLNGETDLSIPWLERAISLNPNYAHGFYAHGLASLMTSDAQRSYHNSEQAISLSPLDPFLYGFYGIKAFSYLADEDISNARIWAEKAAQQPEAIAVMDLLAAATCEMDSDALTAQKWLERGKRRKPDIDHQYFFKALPFGHGKVRALVQSSLERLGV
ncbi:winged helix-turn-helix domain-containing protein [Marinobacter sp. F4206]|uniref:winged helix-turn-helix domain-containing protein n=1 Tax=Marinobacter sp. F4206 TaxID=2861777 RepID=UPI001C5F2144|nr:winged helix-turn-helix domain-containing protein [Marinobacter sp. F4206]MBW4933168.1 winged helix-turn-helix domain-containing protein [Marinobacter sp. F4206]